MLDDTKTLAALSAIGFVCVWDRHGLPVYTSRDGYHVTYARKMQNGDCGPIQVGVLPSSTTIYRDTHHSKRPSQMRMFDGYYTGFGPTLEMAAKRLARVAKADAPVAQRLMQIADALSA